MEYILFFTAVDLYVGMRVYVYSCMCWCEMLITAKQII